MTDMPYTPVATAASPRDTRSAAEGDAANAPKLTRSIGVVGGTLLTLSCLTPASSLFVIVPDSFASLGTGTALTIAIAGLLCIGVAFTYSELGTLIPSSGGEYAMVGTLMGRLAGWLVFIEYGSRRDRAAVEILTGLGQKSRDIAVGKLEFCRVGGNEDPVFHAELRHLFQ